MVKLLFTLTVFFFTVTTLFYVFLTKFNEARKIALNSPTVAGAKITKQKPTVYISPTSKPTEEPIPTPTTIQEFTYSIPVSQMQINNQIISVSAIKIYLAGSPTPTPNITKSTDTPEIPFTDFQIKLAFPNKVNPGSTDNKFIFENNEYEIKVFEGDSLLNQIMYKIWENYIIINPESGIWENNKEIKVVIYDKDGKEVDKTKLSVE